MIPATVGRVDGVQAAVTGETAGTHDFNQQMKSHAPFVFAFVLALCFLLLLVTFRSIVIPIKAVLLNLLSVGAAYGLLVLVFQHRFAQGILGFHSNGAITSWLPLFMFVILFGLSMDYHVFILSRIKELVDGGMSDRGCGCDRDQADRRNGHERSRRDGRRVRDLRHAPDARHQADGLRARRRDPDRLDSGQGRPAAGRDEAARRLELVPAPLARLAAQAERRAWPGSLRSGDASGRPTRRRRGSTSDAPGVSALMSMEQQELLEQVRPAWRVLVVDDHASFRRCASELLIAEGFDVVGEAEDGASALALAARLLPELVLLDIQLPDLDGLAVAERLLASHPELKIVLVSSRDRVDLRLSDRGERSARLHLEGRALRCSTREAAGVTDESLRPGDDVADQAAGFALGDEHALRKARLAEQRNRALLDAIPDTILRYGRDGTYLDARPDATTARALRPGRVHRPERPRRAPGRARSHRPRLHRARARERNHAGDRVRARDRRRRALERGAVRSERRGRGCVRSPATSRSNGAPRRSSSDWRPSRRRFAEWRPWSPAMPLPKRSSRP